MGRIGESLVARAICVVSSACVKGGVERGSKPICVMADTCGQSILYGLDVRAEGCRDAVARHLD